MASRGISAAICSGYSAVPAICRTIASECMRESTSSRAIEMPANTIILTRAEAPCLKSGGGLYSMTSNNQAQCANVRTPVKCRGQTKKGRINLSGPSVRLLVGEDRAELVHALQRHAGTAHHA